MAPPQRDARIHRRRKRPTLVPAHEELETRIVPAPVGLPSIVPAAAMPGGSIAPLGAVDPEAGTGSPTGYSPQQMRAAYGFDAIRFGSIAGDGAGQTIAIVDAYDDPGLVATTAANFSTSDLAQFDRQFGLPDPPSFTKLNEAGNTSPMPGTDPSGPGSGSGNWESEEAMDVEWAHALAPAASIVLVEANSSNTSDLYAGISIAAHLAGVSVISLSWGGAEFSGESFWDENFQTPTSHQGLTFVSSSGDAGAPGIYPAYSQDVLAVGGTALQLSGSGAILGETAWSGSGGGISAYEPEPSYQRAVQSSGFRSIPDVAFDASLATGVSVYDSYDNTGGGPWITMWGTSLGAPSWAALIAVANQGRVAAGGTTLDGASQTLPALYSVPSADFHDITSGSNGAFSAGAGYDEVSGLGTPVANLLAPDLAYYGMSDHLVIAAGPSASLTAGQPFGATIQVERPDGTLDPSTTGTLTISLGNPGGGASLGGTLSATIDRGVATFAGLSINQAGPGNTLAVSGGGFGSVTSSSFVVTPAAATQLVVAAQPPSSSAAGGSFGLTLDAEDAFGNLVGDYAGVVTLSLTGGQGGAGLGGAINTAASGGVASFGGLSIDQAGTGYTFQSTATGLATATTGTFAITPAAPAQLVVDGPASSLTAGAGFGIAVTVEDAYGNIESGYGGDVTLSLGGGPAGAVLGGATTESAVGGVATFSELQLTQAGSGYTIDVASGSLPDAQTGSFEVTPAAPAQLDITRPPASAVAAGSSFGLGVAVEDAFGNLVTQSDAEVSLTLRGGPAGTSLVGNATGAAVDGVATFDGLSIDSVGAPYRIEAASPGLASSTTSDLSVTPAAPSQLVIVDQPPGQTVAGQGFGFTAAVEDAFGNVATGFNGRVTASLTNGLAGGLLTGPVSTNAVNGTATFAGLSLNQAGGGYSVQAGSDGLTSVVSAPITVSPSAPSRLVVTVQPSGSVSARRSFAVGVQAVDAYGNLATEFTGNVTASLAANSDRNALRGTLSVQAQGGEAIVTDATLRRTGKSYAITLTSNGLTPAATSAFKVTRPASGGGATDARGLSRIHGRSPAHAMNHPMRMIHGRRLHRPS